MESDEGEMVGATLPEPSAGPLPVAITSLGGPSEE